jgi:hypothetical protein
MTHAAPQIGGFVVLSVFAVLIFGPYFVARFFPDSRIPDRWLLPGKLIRDYGIVSSKRNWFVIQRCSMALCEKKGVMFLVFRSAGFTPLGWGVNQSRMELSNLAVLEQVVADAKRLKAERVSLST